MVVRIIAAIVLLLLCATVRTKVEFELSAEVTRTITPYHFYPGTGFSREQYKTLIRNMQTDFASVVPRIKSMSFESLALQSSTDDKALRLHYETLYRHLRDAEQQRLLCDVVQRKYNNLRGAEKRRLLEDEAHRSLTKKAKYLEACVRAKCSKGQQCSDVGTCQACKIGTFASANFVLRCTECPAGTHGTEAVDKDEKGACKPCTPGFYTDKTGQAECTPCPPGTFQNTTRATKCHNAKVPAHTKLCNDTHFFPEGSTDVDTATTPVFRNGAECPSSKTRKNDLPKWAIALLCVLGGMLIGACILCFVC